MKLLKFFTKCCGQCKQQTKLLNDFTDIEVVPVDCDQNKDLVDKYDVKGLPTLVIVDDDENMVTKFTGLVYPKTIRKAIETI